MRVYRRGFTLLEVMISLLILAVGVLGLMAMQVSSLNGNKASRDTTEATSLARRMLEMLKRDSFDWNLLNDIASSSEVPLLQPASADMDAGVATAWLNIPSTVIPGIESAGINYMVDRELRPNGAPSGVTVVSPARYCIHYKLTWMTPNELLLAEARVTWPRQEKQGATITLCSPTVPNCCNTPTSAIYSDNSKMNSTIVSTFVSRRPKPGQP